LKTLDEQPVAEVPAAPAAETEELPDWLKDMSADEQAPAAPASVSGWLPAAETASAPPAVVQPPAVTREPVVQPAKPAPVAVEPVAKPVAPKPLRLRPTTGLQDKEAFFINRAREALDRGSLEESMGNYTKLIKKGKLLEEVIDDLSEIVYRHPVDVVVWQTLGDAYMRSNRLQEALDSYTKAEELLRR
jgi:tetratricopeptide (TPR) repeat protein